MFRSSVIDLILSFSWSSNHGYQSTVDYPGFLLYQEIYNHFPGSKVILTTRDPESWYESASKTIFTASPNFLQKLKILTKLPFSKRMRQLMPVFAQVDYLWDVIFEGKLNDKDYMIRRFLAHEKKVKESIPKRDLLVYKVGDGWDPLCKFLGVSNPSIPFPRSNGREGFQKNLEMIRNGIVPKVS
ncbi:MAG: hypothetical protein KDC53_22770 [Saprospiraceae bacterium]|nr:hypothetical protein [Saprospiraceae bacterium]